MQQSNTQMGDLTSIKPRNLHELAHGSAFAAGTVGRAFAIVWFRTPELEELQDFVALLRQFARRTPQAMLITVLRPGVMLSDEGRRYFASVFPTFKGKLAASTVVIEGDGFWVAAARALVAGLTFITKQPFPHKSFGSVAEAATWMGQIAKVPDISFAAEVAQYCEAQTASPAIAV